MTSKVIVKLGHEMDSLSSKITAVEIPIKNRTLMVMIKIETCWLLLQM